MTSERKRWKSGLQVPATSLQCKLISKADDYGQKDPVVSVMVKTISAPGSSASIRVIGAAATPKSVPYRAGLTVLDVIIDVGGLTTFAAGNDAQLISNQGGASRSIPLHLRDLIKGGDLKANIALMPGDVISIPERGF